MRLLKVMGIITLFIAGVLTGLMVGSASGQTWPVGTSGDSVQFSDNQLDSNGRTDNQFAQNIAAMNPFATLQAKESPKDRIPEKAIDVYSDRVIIDIKQAQWATFTDTHSMEPVISAGSNAIEIVPQSSDDIKVGDIVSYKSEYSDGSIIHRVVYKGTDEQGTYFIMKGDNIPTSDPGRVRFSQMQRVVVAIIY